MSELEKDLNILCDLVDSRNICWVRGEKEGNENEEKIEQHKKLMLKKYQLKVDSLEKNE